MKYILSEANVDRLAQLAWSRVLVGFDFDGTLAPVVARPDEARMRPRTSRLLGRICELYPCAVISGRSQSDLQRRLGKTRPEFVVGNHGIGPESESRRYAATIRKTDAVLREVFDGPGGVHIENKGYSLSVHYRSARRQKETRKAIQKVIKHLPAVRIVHGKAVVNILPSDAPNKGDALLRFRRIAGADTALFVGDDLTDEDIFTLDQPGRLLTIRIGASRTSQAAYYLRSQREIDDLLKLLVQYRTRESTR